MLYGIADDYEVTTFLVQEVDVEERRDEIVTMFSAVIATLATPLTEVVRTREKSLSSFCHILKRFFPQMPSSEFKRRCVCYWRLPFRCPRASFSQLRTCCWMVVDFLNLKSWTVWWCVSASFSQG